MQVVFGITLDRNHPDIKNAAPVMSRPSRTPVLAQRLGKGSYVNTLWGYKGYAKPGDYAVFYRFERNPKTGEAQVDAHAVDEVTFEETYSPKQGGLSYSQLGWMPPKAPFYAYKTAAVHGLHLPSPSQDTLISREDESEIPEGHVVIVNGRGYPYPNAAERAFKNYRPINETDLDRNGESFTPKQIQQSKAIHQKLGHLLNAFA